jgi:hypothetical protein
VNPERLYVRRIDSGRGGWLRRSRRYEVWQPDGQKVIALRQLDDLLQGRRYPADFWAVVHAADAAFERGARQSWFESGTGREVESLPE